MLREIKPRNARSARALAKREPQIHEQAKKAIFLRGTSTSGLINDVSTDIFAIRKPLAIRFSKKNPIHPFEDASSLEFFSQKNDASLFCLSSHSKKRPHNLTFARIFAGSVLDMLECTVTPDTARCMKQFGGKTVRTGLKPLLAFSGEPFAEADAGVEGDSVERFRTAKSLFSDFFKGEDVEQLDVEGLQCLITFAAEEKPVEEGKPQQTVYMRVWRLVTKKSGHKLPRVELEEIGPRLDFRLGRVKVADKEMLKEAMRKAKGTEPRTKKNIETDLLGDKTGRIHVGRQELSELQTRKMKGLKRGRDALDEQEEEEPSEDEDVDMEDIAEDVMSDEEDGGVSIVPKRQKTEVAG